MILHRRSITTFSADLASFQCGCTTSVSARVALHWHCERTQLVRACIPGLGLVPFVVPPDIAWPCGRNLH
jgi:hypothetical protein